MLMVFTIAPLSIQDSFRSTRAIHVEALEGSGELSHERGMDRACAVIPFLYTTGFFLSFSALFLKSWRLAKLFTTKS